MFINFNLPINKRTTFICEIIINKMKFKKTPPGGLEPPTFRLTAERASQLRHGGLWIFMFLEVN